MSDAPTLIYLEADDEITTVVRRLRDAEAGRVVVVAPGRSRATSSAVALRLLARAAERAGREISVVGDALTRSLAAEAGLSAYASVDDARRAEPATAEPAEVRHAAIHVVRGAPAEETAPILPAATGNDEPTVAVPVARPPQAPSRAHTPPPPPRRRPATTNHHRPARRRLSVALLLGGLAAVLVGWGVIAALILPAASIRIVPRTDVIGPVDDVIAISDPERISGTVHESVPVTPTGTYETNEPASGMVTFFNWTFSNVTVPAGSLVATGNEPGDQAFETTATIVVPSGRFDPFGGGITAGEANVGVLAAANGPDGNVEAEAIDTILDPGLRGQLRGFPTITQRLVINADPTSGGANESGTEVTQEDVDAAVAALTDALDDAAAEKLAESEGKLSADAAEPAEPEIEIPDDLVGTRDPDSLEISGTLAYDRVAVDPHDVIERATERFNADTTHLPTGHEIIPEATQVTVGEVRREGDTLQVAVRVTGESTATVDRDTVLQRVIGLSVTDAQAALSDLGTATVTLWPGWVSTVPDRDWRIDLEIGDGTE